MKNWCFQNGKAAGILFDKRHFCGLFNNLHECWFKLQFALPGPCTPPPPKKVLLFPVAKVFLCGFEHR